MIEKNAVRYDPQQDESGGSNQIDYLISKKILNFPPHKSHLFRLRKLQFFSFNDVFISYLIHILK